MVFALRKKEKKKKHSFSPQLLLENRDSLIASFTFFFPCCHLKVDVHFLYVILN